VLNFHEKIDGAYNEFIKKNQKLNKLVSSICPGTHNLVWKGRDAPVHRFGGGGRPPYRGLEGEEGGSRTKV
jgi:hypothetical protein